MTDATARRVEWALLPVPPTPRSIIELIRAGTLDAELAATLWLLIEGRVPVVVAAPEAGMGRTTILDALLAFLAPGVRSHEVRADGEPFTWLPQATELGWHGTPPAVGEPADVRPDTTVLTLSEIGDDVPGGVWGDEARIAIRAATVGYGIAATIRAGGLQEVFDRLRRPPMAISDDELSRLGVVLVLDRARDRARTPRVAAAHYVRPVARDEHGHVQRLGPAVLTTWDAATDSFEHFGWGITPELAIRVGRRAGDLEFEIERRRSVLDGLAAIDTLAIDDALRALSAAADADPANTQEDRPA